MSKLHQLAQSGDLLGLQKAIAGWSPATIKTKLDAYYLGGTVLHHAVDSHNLELISFLLAKGANVNAPYDDELQSSVLLYAAQYKLRDLLPALIAHGANPGYVNLHGDSAAHFAAQNNAIGFMQDMIAWSPEAVDLQNVDGHTPLMIAAQLGYEKIVEQLLVAGADPFKQAGDGNNALHLSMMGRHIAVAQCLLKFNPGLAHVLNNSSWQPIHHAAHAAFAAGIKLLAANKVDLHAKMRNSTPIRLLMLNKEYSGTKEQISAMIALLAVGADPHQVCQLPDIFPLTVAAVSKNENLLRVLLARTQHLSVYEQALSYVDSAVIKALLVEHLAKQIMLMRAAGEASAEMAKRIILLEAHKPCLAVDKVTSWSSCALMFSKPLSPLTAVAFELSTTPEPAISPDFLLELMSARLRYSSLLNELWLDSAYRNLVCTYKNPTDQSSLLHAAVKLSHVDVVTDMVLLGADPADKDLSGVAVWQLAKMHKRAELDSFFAWAVTLNARRLISIVNYIIVESKRGDLVENPLHELGVVATILLALNLVTHLKICRHSTSDKAILTFQASDFTYDLCYCPYVGNCLTTVSRIQALGYLDKRWHAEAFQLGELHYPKINRELLVHYWQHIQTSDHDLLATVESKADTSSTMLASLTERSVVAGPDSPRIVL